MRSGWISRLVVALALVLCTTLAGGCAALIIRNGITDPLIAERAELSGLPGVRYWGDEIPTDVVAELHRRLPSLPKLAQGAHRINGRPVVDILALSGGGNDGAYGAGLLTGWSKRGDRPEFEVVTGVSAGAIIAPFAFLGPRYDPQLKRIWTEYRTDQIVVAQILPGLLGGSALADTAPLEKLIESYVDDRMLRAVAAEYRRGRILLIGTTNLDAQRPVVWNMGEIAAHGTPAAAQLFRKVILASAAIPGAFPPVNLPVQVAGRQFDEMHVDGGTTRDVFVSPVAVPLKSFDVLYDAPPIRRIYIIKNGKVAPEQDAVPAQTIPIAARAISTLIKSQHEGELYRIYRMAQDAGAEFHFAAIPGSFREKPKEFFDPDYQSALFDQGYVDGYNGAAWTSKPPELITTQARR